MKDTATYVQLANMLKIPLRVDHKILRTVLKNRNIWVKWTPTAVMCSMHTKCESNIKWLAHYNKTILQSEFQQTSLTGKQPNFLNKTWIITPSCGENNCLSDYIQHLSIVFKILTLRSELHYTLNISRMVAYDVKH